MENVIGETIQRKREERGWRKYHLAQYLETESRQVMLWEMGVTKPGAYYLERLADLFGCSVDEMMGRDATRVVRCKNCVHREWKDMFGSVVILECRLTGLTKKPEGFCSEGIKEGETQGG